MEVVDPLLEKYYSAEFGLAIFYAEFLLTLALL